MGKTLYEKIWDAHLISDEADNALIYIDRHLVHEVTSPQAFEGLRIAGRKVRSPKNTLAVADHNVPTTDRSKGIQEEDSRVQVETLTQNCAEFGIEYFSMQDKRQGIVHIVGPEQGFTLPGMTIVCGDSHTSTHGAFGALAFGIGTSEVEHVLATQSLIQKKSKTLRVNVVGKAPIGVTAKDITLAIIGEIGTAGGTGYVIEYAGEAIRDLSMEGRMTVCNMSIEAGARAGLIAPDEKTYDYLRGRQYTPKNYESLVEYWRENLKSDDDAKFEKQFTLHIDDIAPQVSWGTNPGMTCDVTETVPTPEEFSKGDSNQKKGAEKALDYMDLEAGTPIEEIKIDRVFIGSCTNARLEDLIEASKVIKGQKISSDVRAMVVPGSQMVKKQAEEMGLDKIFTDANFEWREAGCSMCLGMNPDILSPGERCASTSNRNFEGRQGTGGRTHLVSPVMAAAAAINGHFVDVRKMDLS